VCTLHKGGPFSVSALFFVFHFGTRLPEKSNTAYESRDLSLFLAIDPIGLVQLGLIIV
jgi:hypothetical protein